jgi:hypothetical protein
MDFTPMVLGTEMVPSSNACDIEKSILYVELVEPCRVMRMPSFVGIRMVPPSRVYFFKVLFSGIPDDIVV